MVRMQRRRDGAEGIYRCAIPDTFGFIQNIYIGVYSANNGELLMYTAVILQCPDPTSSRASLCIAANVHTHQEILYHCAEVAKAFVTYRLCFVPYKFLARKRPIKSKESAKCHQTLSSQVGSEHKTKVQNQSADCSPCELLPRQHLRTLLISLLLYMYSDVAKVTHQLSFITKFIVYCMHTVQQQIFEVHNFHSFRGFVLHVKIKLLETFRLNFPESMVQCGNRMIAIPLCSIAWTSRATWHCIVVSKQTLPDSWGPPS